MYKGIDYILIITIIILTAFGTIMVFGATTYMVPIQNEVNSFRISQIRNLLVGFSAFTITSFFPYRFLKNKYLIYTLLFSILILLSLIAFGMTGNTVKGANRWVAGIQPSEFSRLILILFFAYSLAKNRARLKEFKVGIVFYYSIALLFAILILKQPAFSAAALITMILIMMTYIAGNRFKHNLIILAVLIPVSLYAMTMESYRMNRIISFLGLNDNVEMNYQVKQALIAIGNGGLDGVGIGKSKAKEGYLPESHNDYIFAFISDETGFIGALILISVYIIMIWRISRIALLSEDFHAKLLASGVALMVFLYVVVHILINVDIFPTTGTTLPLVSYGGSSLLINLTALGIVMNIGYSSYRAKNGFSKN
ncbi:MAG: FtsW/RodA/SpoVE family cell cycle protein [Candidatus Delongbacteria bacterium]|nr:FtsW/RodA/SpoVE family cell cycle protein [Candidatus Delongbacteria bacterium]MBN2836834.1 FtsW/RodA/SpoVE family cell cycle protein [Candidatus Delongbacteria bacterium]